MSLPPGFLARPFAHRGLHGPGRPENSLAAMRAAVRAGFGIEIDVQPSADGRAMAFHDDVLDRMTAESGPIRARDSASLRRTRLRDGDDGIPTLDEALALIGGAVPLLIEIKDQDGAMGGDVGGLESLVAEALTGYPGPVAVMSFNPHSVAVMAELAPTVPRGLTTCAFTPEDWPLPGETARHLAAIPDYDRTGACFISHGHRDLDLPRVAALKSRGAAILCWTIRSAAEEEAARRIADQITFEGYTPAS